MKLSRDELSEQLRGQVLLALWDIFKENGIKIPFPHREVIMKTPVTVTPSDTKA